MAAETSASVVSVPVRATGADALNAIFALRTKVWTADGAQFPPGVVDWVDDFDQTAHHWAIYDDSELIAASRMTVHNSVDELLRVPNPVNVDAVREQLGSTRCPIAYHGRLVVAPAAQGRGLSHKLVDAMLKESFELGVATVFGLTSNPRVASLYAARGFIVRSTSNLAIGRTHRSGLLLIRDLRAER